MYKKIFNVRRFYLCLGGHYVTITKDYEVYLDGYRYLCKLEDAFYIYEWNAELIIADIYGKAFVLEQENRLKPLLDMEYSVFNVFGYYALIRREYNDKTYSGLYDLAKKKILFETDLGIGGNSIDDVMCFTKNDDIMSFDIQKQEILWQFSLSTLPSYKDIWGKEKPAEVIQILGIYENVLWVHIAGFRLIGLDVKNGELLHNFDNLLKGKSENVFLDELLGRIKILSYDYYGEFDLKTLSFVKEEMVQCIDDVKIRASNFIKGDKNLYFCGYHNESLHPNAFGIFDTEKAEIVWYETTKDDLGYFYNPPQASEKLLAILDDKQNLLIYERD